MSDSAEKRRTPSSVQMDKPNSVAVSSQSSEMADHRPEMARDRRWIEMAQSPAPPPVSNSNNGVVQRVTYNASKRGIPKAQKNKTLQAIQAQHKSINKVKTLYIPPENDGDWEEKPIPLKAVTSSSGTHPVRVERESAPNLRENLFYDTWPMRFKSKFLAYVVDLVTGYDGGFKRKDIQPAQIGRDSVTAPFDILKRIISGSRKSDMGRTFIGRDAWGFEDEPDEAVDAAKLKEIQKQYGLEPGKYIGNLADAGDYAELPGEHDGFVFYVHEGDEATAGNVHKHRDRREMTTAEFDGKYNPENDKQMQAISQVHRVDRGDSDRDPGKTMGGPAHLAAVDELQPASSVSGSLSSHEWCHLIGDGDGGPDMAENLVIGTHQVNTEQLGMETALRGFRHQFEHYGYGIQITVKVITRKEDDLAAGLDKRRTEFAARVTDLETKIAAAKGKSNADKRTRLKAELAQVSSELQYLTDHSNAEVAEEEIHADFISYQIDLLKNNSDEESPIYRRIMDARRGTITFSEFKMIQTIVSNKLKAALEVKKKEYDTLVKSYLSDDHDSLSGKLRLRDTRKAERKAKGALKVGTSRFRERRRDMGRLYRAAALGELDSWEETAAPEEDEQARVKKRVHELGDYLANYMAKYYTRFFKVQSKSFNETEFTALRKMAEALYEDDDFPEDLFDEIMDEFKSICVRSTKSIVSTLAKETQFSTPQPTRTRTALPMPGTV
ncbi:hypothetical protein KFE98_20800 [bacterium SCSIO 12741]|nr:hypothetical protein KFE98_20800 [bacterium SCSIO 12741]